MTASLSGGWVPETSRSFHYWQPVPRWRLLPWLANPGNSTMSSHPGEGNKHPSQWKKGGLLGKTALTMSCHFKQCCKFTLKAQARTPQMKSRWNSESFPYVKTADC